jgi:hypothetical protein
MIPLTYKAHTDQGAPRLIDGPDDTHGIAVSQGDRGRWLITPDPAAISSAAPNLSFTLNGRLGTDLINGETEIIIVFWRDAAKTLHSTDHVLARSGVTDFLPFSCSFTMPAEAVSFRIDFRLWSGSGTAELRDLTLATVEPRPEPPAAEPPPPNQDNTTGLPVPSLPAAAVPVSGYLWGDNLFLVRGTLTPPDLLDMR